jgi:NADP-dependent 3-hydroxy acid dehydrogenase YdfG
MPGALDGKVALIAGASSGIGEAAAIALAAAGATVAVAARRVERLQSLVQRIEAAGGRGIALPGDLSDEPTARRIVAEAVAKLGRLDILVNSAGALQPGGVADADLAQWRAAMQINFFASLYTCHAAIAPMKAQGGGDIVNISSTAGRRAAASFGPYSASKFGLTAMTEGLRQEVGAHGIRVCIIEPGATTTEVAESIPDPATRDAIRTHVGKDGAMKPEDIAATILFIVTLPPRANVSEILIRPTIDTAPT